MRELNIIIYMKPRGQARSTPFVNRKTGKVIYQYHDCETPSYAFRRALNSVAEDALFEGWEKIPEGIPVALSITAYFKIPKDKINKVFDGDDCPHHSDINNIIKAVEDSFNKKIWKDDRQVTRYEPAPKKLWTSGDERIEIIVRRVNDNGCGFEEKDDNETAQIIY